MESHFNITTLADDNQHIKRLCKGYNRENYDIIWITEGSGCLSVNDSKYPVAPNFLYCGAPGQFQQMVVDQSIKGVIISFNYDFIHQGSDDDRASNANILTEFLNFSVIRLEEEGIAELNVLIEKMQLELISGQQMKTEILRFYLRIVLIHIRRRMTTPVAETSTLNNTVRKFLTHIEMNFLTKRSVSEYASMLCVTANYLNQVVKKQTGGTAGFYIRRRVITEAKRKALHSDQTMKEVAFSLGFDSEAHFSLFFKNYAGVSFSQFKRTKQLSITNNF
ncbi:MAG: AraC family transcriptional regulator [Bacteroidota bacterium]